ncbi:hypothetical protein WICMUC_004999 [Wickerhamomyces mucosus]|uniref:E3 ubiquitin protein ligase n=1 Tax=Wickerhamomyces mucosus TaxID=1378264 RepID=A0A9P8PCN4_9ASCO|nr:hypothetical protein WICMUC_004999 [Wickerhamomyces mucosus]
MSEKRDLDTEKDSNSIKRIKLDELSEKGPLTQEDVVYFQKEAIFRQLKLSRSKNHQLNKQLKFSNNEIDKINRKFSYLKNLINQFIEYLKPYQDELTNNGNNLLIDLEFNQDNDELKLIFDKLSNSISRNFGNLPKELDSVEISKKFHQLQTTYDSLKLENSQILAKFKQLNQDYLNIINESQRFQSKTLERIKPKVEHQIKEEESQIAEQNKDIKIVGNHDDEKLKINIKSDNEIDNSKLIELNHKIDEYESTIETQKKLLNDQILSNQRLNEQINLLNISKREEIDVKNSEIYLNLIKDYDLLNSNYLEINKNYELLVEKFNKFELDISSNNELISKKFQDEKSKIVQHFEKLELDLIRIRTIRDDLLSKINIIENSKDSQEIIKELNKTIEIQKSTIELFQFGNEKLDEILTKDNHEITNNDNDDELIKLQKSNSTLINELKEFEKLFKNLQSINFKKFQHLIENESIINKYRVEKKKADEKYFAVMRTKDSMINEIKSLKDLNKKFENKLIQLEDFKKFQNLEITNQINKNLSFEKLINNQKNLLTNSNLKVEKLTNSLNSEIKKNLNSSTQLNELIQFKNKSINEINEYELKISKLQSQIKSQSIQLEQRSLSSKSLSSSNKISNNDNNAELDSFRSLIYCSLCSKNWKDTTIKTCGHVFCNECVQERLNARMRKCPTCNKPFSSNDILNIHL